MRLLLRHTRCLVQFANKNGSLALHWVYYKHWKVHTYWQLIRYHSLVNKVRLTFYELQIYMYICVCVYTHTHSLYSDPKISYIVMLLTEQSVRILQFFCAVICGHNWTMQRRPHEEISIASQLQTSVNCFPWMKQYDNDWLIVKQEITYDMQQGKKLPAICRE